MKLWILRPNTDLPPRDNPWDPWYDKAFGFIVRAPTEDAARALAHEHAGDENRGQFVREQIANTTAPWLDPKYSSCIELTRKGPAGMLMNDFRSA